MRTRTMADNFLLLWKVEALHEEKLRGVQKRPMALVGGHKVDIFTILTI